MMSLWEKACVLSRSYIAMGAIVFLMPLSALANVTLIESFLNNLQSEVVEDLNYKADRGLDLFECSADLNCESPEIF